MLEKYPNDVKLVIKHFPLRMHKFADHASRAALAAARQGKYAEMTSILLKNYKSLNEDTIKKYAADIGLDMEQFSTAYNDPLLANQISKDMQLGRAVKVRGVPKMFVNGREVGRDRSLAGFSRMVDEELKKQ